MTTEKPETVAVGSDGLLGVLREIAQEQRECELQCIHAPKAKAMYSRRVAGIETALGEITRLKSKAKLADKLTPLENRLAELHGALEKCFHHFGEEIKRKTLNESAADGTQALSREVARVLDGSSPNHRICDTQK